MKKISREYLNNQIINKLDFEQFYLDFQDRTEKDYEVEYEVDGYKFLTVFTVEVPHNYSPRIKVENEFWGTRINGKQETEFKAIYRSNGSKTLDQLFDEWIENYKEWLYE